MRIKSYWEGQEDMRNRIKSALEDQKNTATVQDNDLIDRLITIVEDLDATT